VIVLTRLTTRKQTDDGVARAAEDVRDVHINTANRIKAGRKRAGVEVFSSSSLLLSSLELSDTKSIRLKYEPSSEPLHISAK
jgi:hypothetical protein